MSETAPSVAPTETAIAEMMCNAVEKVFQTMARRGVHLLRTYIPDRQRPAPPEIEGSGGLVVVGSVGFVGRANGVVYLYLSESFAIHLTCEILGLSAAELGVGDFALVKDAIGELTNVIVGTFKNQLCDRGLDCNLTIPSILHGSGLTVEKVADATRRVFEFETGGHRFWADLLCERFS
jgi:chemotaxis protein CheX